MVNFESDETKQERDIDVLTQEITGYFRHAETLLSKFGKEATGPEITVSEQTIRSNMQRSMAKKLQGLSSSFRAGQKVFNF